MAARTCGGRLVHVAAADGRSRRLPVAEVAEQDLAAAGGGLGVALHRLELLPAHALDGPRSLLDREPPLAAEAAQVEASGDDGAGPRLELDGADRLGRGQPGA